MNDLMDFSNLELSSTSLSQFLIGFIVTVFLSLLLRLIYIKYSDSVSNKSLIANIFPLNQLLLDFLGNFVDPIGFNH